MHTRIRHAHAPHAWHTHGTRNLFLACTHTCSLLRVCAVSHTHKHAHTHTWSTEERGGDRGNAQDASGPPHRYQQVATAPHLSTDATTLVSTQLHSAPQAPPVPRTFLFCVFCFVFSSFVSLFAGVCACVHATMRACVHACVHACVCSYVRTCACVRACVCACVRACVRALSLSLALSLSHTLSLLCACVCSLSVFLALSLLRMLSTCLCM